MNFDQDVHDKVCIYARKHLKVIIHDSNKRTIIDYIDPENQLAIKQFGARAFSPTAVTPEGIARDTCGEGAATYVLETPLIKWATYPVTYAINPVNPYLDEATVIAAVDASFQTYNDEMQATIFTRVSDINTAKFTVQFTPIDGDGSTVAYCNYQWNTSNAITGAQIVLDTSDKWFVSPVQRCGYYGDAFDIQNVLTHEIGHGIGIAHSPDPLATMYAYVNTGETLRRTLAVGDAMAVHQIYGPAKQWPDESTYGPIVVNGQYNPPYQVITIENVGKVAFRTAFLDAVKAAGWGRARGGKYLGYKGGGDIAIRWVSSATLPIP